MLYLQEKALRQVKMEHLARPLAGFNHLPLRGCRGHFKQNPEHTADAARLQSLEGCLL